MEGGYALVVDQSRLKVGIYMKPRGFEYQRPGSLAMAVDQLAAYGEEAKLLAGGQSLVPLMSARLVAPKVVIDVSKLTELKYIRHGSGRVAIGAGTTHRAVELSPDFSGTMVADGVGRIGHVAIRNVGTVGGSIAHADPAAEWAGILLALGGEVSVESRRGARSIESDRLFLGPYDTSLESDEVLTEITLPIGSGDGSRVVSAFEEVSRRAGDFAVVGVGAAIFRGSDPSGSAWARVSVVGVGGAPWRAAHVEGAVLGVFNDGDWGGSGNWGGSLVQAVRADLDENDAGRTATAYQCAVLPVVVERCVSRAIERGRREDG